MSMEKSVTARKEPKVKTRDKLLDIAESLFAEHGFDGVSVRDITDAAQVRLASVNYHFKTKQNLFVEVVRRRADVLNADRKSALEAIPLHELGAEEGVRAIVHAFIDPMYRRSTQGDEGWKNYCRLIAQQAALKQSPNITADLFNPLALELIDLLKSALPGLGDREAHYAFQYLVGAMVYLFTENERLDILSEGKYSSHELDSLCDELASFVAAGVLSMVRPK